MVTVSKFDFSDEEFLEFRLSVSDNDYEYFFADSYGIGVVGLVKVEGDIKGCLVYKGTSYATIAITSVKTGDEGNYKIDFKHIILCDNDVEYNISRDITKQAGFSDEEIKRAWDYCYNYRTRPSNCE